MAPHMLLAIKITRRLTNLLYLCSMELLFQDYICYFRYFIDPTLLLILFSELFDVFLFVLLLDLFLVQ